MQLHRSLVLAALGSICVRAQSVQEPPVATINPALSTSLVAAASATPSNLGDPTQLSTYPLCAVSQPLSSSYKGYECLTAFSKDVVDSTLPRRLWSILDVTLPK